MIASVAKSFELNPEALRTSGSLLSAQIAVGDAIERCAVADLDHDPTTVDLLIRLHLAPQQKLRAVTLCEQLLKSPSHISRLIDRAEALHLVTREPDPEDRRASLIALNQEGANVVEQFGPRLNAVLTRVIHDVLSPEEEYALVTLLERVEKAARDCSLEDSGTLPSGPSY